MRIATLTIFLAASALAQTPGPSAPSFEVATIKPSDPDKCCSRNLGTDGRHFFTTNTTLKSLIQWAWNLQAKQVIAGPGWMDQERFNVIGQVDGAVLPSDYQWKLALQQLLIERFKLQLRHDKKEMAAYVLVIAKGGPKLIPGDNDPAHLQRAGFGGNTGQTMTGGVTNGTIPEMAGELQRIVLDRAIVDHTGLTGTYNIELSFTREDPGATGTTIPS